jgi:hypothetical protein
MMRKCLFILKNKRVKDCLVSGIFFWNSLISGASNRKAVLGKINHLGQIWNSSEIRAEILEFS